MRSKLSSRLAQLVDDASLADVQALVKAHVEPATPSRSHRYVEVVPHPRTALPKVQMTEPESLSAAKEERSSLLAEFSAALVLPKSNERSAYLVSRQARLTFLNSWIRGENIKKAQVPANLLAPSPKRLKRQVMMQMYALLLEAEDFFGDRSDYHEVLNLMEDRFHAELNDERSA